MMYIALFYVLFMMLISSALAAEERRKEDDEGIFNIVIENDIFAGSDSDYIAFNV